MRYHNWIFQDSEVVSQDRANQEYRMLLNTSTWIRLNESESINCFSESTNEFSRWSRSKVSGLKGHSSLSKNIFPSNFYGITSLVYFSLQDTFFLWRWLALLMHSSSVATYRLHYCYFHSCNHNHIKIKFSDLICTHPILFYRAEYSFEK